MMTCLEFRRALMADNVISEEMKEHASGCKACSAFAAQTKQQEASIARALMVEPPESLAAKILFRQRSNELQPNDIESLNLPVLSRLEDAMLVDVPQGLAARVIAAKDSEKAASHESGEKSASNIELFQPRQLIKFAMAASIAVAVAAVSLLSLNRETPTLASEVVAHVAAEAHLLNADEELGRGDLEPILRTVGVDLNDMPGRVTTAFACPARKQLSLHMVMDGAHGKVTVLVMPGETIDAPQAVHKANMKGLVVPVRHGSIGIVGDVREDLDIHASRVRKILRWRL